MKPAKPKTTTQVLDSLSRAQVLQCLAFVQHRRARDEVLQRLIEARLASLTSAPAATNGHGKTFLTIKDIAREFGLTPNYIRGLVDDGKLAAMRVPGERGYIRVSRDSVNAFIKENGQKSENGGGYL